MAWGGAASHCFVGREKKPRNANARSRWVNHGRRKGRRGRCINCGSIGAPQGSYIVSKGKEHVASTASRNSGGERGGDFAFALSRKKERTEVRRCPRKKKREKENPSRAKMRHGKRGEGKSAFCCSRTKCAERRKTTKQFAASRPMEAKGHKKKRGHLAV